MRSKRKGFWIIWRLKKYCERKNVKKNPLIFCLVGPPGVGKTTFAGLLAQALKKKLFTVALGGVSNSSVLLGTNESSLGTEAGQLTKALTETQTGEPLILLDEVDKVSSYGGDSAIHSCLNAVLDPTQNQEILDYYLDVKLDFSQATFIITVNDQKKIPGYLLSKTPEIIKLVGYNLEQKKEIANKFIKKWFDQNSSLSQDNFEIISEALETLISKTKEQGVRQLKSALDSIFDYCLLQWAQQATQGNSESKITIDTELIHKIIPHDFSNIDSGNEPENEKNELDNLRRELATLRGDKNHQTELKAVRFNSLLVLRQIRSHFNEKEYQDYEGKINTATSREEIEVVVKEFLLKAKQKNTSKPIKEEKEDKKIQDELAEIKSKTKDLEGKIKPLNDEIKKLKGENQNLQGRREQEKNLLRMVVVVLIIWGFYGILKLLNFFRKAKGQKKQKR